MGRLSSSNFAEDSQLVILYDKMQRRFACQLRTAAAHATSAVVWPTCGDSTSLWCFDFDSQ